jgi:hypothetical protein
MSLRPNVQSVDLKDGVLTVKGESTKPRFEVLNVVVVQQGKKTEVAAGEPQKDSLNWTAVLEQADGFATGGAEALGVEIRVEPFQVTSWSQSVQIR